MIGMSAHKVYFDYIYDAKNNNVILGVYILDGDGDVIHEIFTKSIKGQGPVNKNNLVYSTQALTYAIQIAQQNFLEKVIFVNQNEIIFNWVLNEDVTDRPYVNEARDAMVKYVLEYESDAQYDFTIKGKQNLAKKELTRIQKKLFASRSNSGDVGMGSFSEWVKTKQEQHKPDKITNATTTKQTSQVDAIFKKRPVKLGYKSRFKQEDLK